MKTSRFLVPASLLLAATAIGLTGCNTFKSRAKEKSETFAQLTPDEKHRLKKGDINVGDTPDMVYIALGNPDEKRERTERNGASSVWIYRTYIDEYAGSVWAGYRRVIVPARGGRGYIVYHEPITQDVYRTRVDEVIRVTFANGVVSTVEQSKR